MNQKTDSTSQREYELGRAFSKALRQIADNSARSRLSLLLDLLEDDDSLLAPLRHIVESPNFQELINESSRAARLARQDTLLRELSAWCNHETLKRLEAFLAGAFSLPTRGHSWISQNLEEFNTNIETFDQSVDGRRQFGSQKEPGRTPAETTRLHRERGNNFSTEESIAVLQAKAHAATLSGKNQKAIELLTNALQLDPAKASLYMQRGSLYAKSQDTGSAIRDFTSVLRLEPNNINALAQRGQAHALLGDTKKAISDWEKSAKAGHDESRKWISIQLIADARQLFELGQYHKSLDALEKAKQFSPLNSNSYTLRGQAYQELAYHGMAISAFNYAILLDPQNAQAFALNGKSCKHMGNHKSALKNWKTAARLGFSDAEKWIAELEESINPSTTKEHAKTSRCDSPLPNTDANKSSATGIFWPAIGTLASLFGLIAIASTHIFRNHATSSESGTAGSPASGHDLGLIKERLDAARNHNKSAALICEHQKIIDAFAGVDFAGASQAQLEEKNSLLSKAKAAIKHLDAPGKSPYWEDCQNGVGLQVFDDYKWDHGKDFTGSLFAVASQKCTTPAIQITAFSNSQRTNKIYSKWLAFYPNPAAKRSARVSFRIPASSLPRQGSIWLSYKARCNSQ